MQIEFSHWYSHESDRHHYCFTEMISNNKIDIRIGKSENFKRKIQ